MANDNKNEMPPDPFGSNPMLADMLAMGMTFYSMFKGFQEGGFTKNEALELTKVAVAEMFRAAGERNNGHGS